MFVIFTCKIFISLYFSQSISWISYHDYWTKIFLLQFYGSYFILYHQNPKFVQNCNHTNFIYNYLIARNGNEERGDESDYYTPEEPAPATGPLYDGGAPPVQ